MPPLLARLLLAVALVGNGTLNEVLASLMVLVPASAAADGPASGCHAAGRAAADHPPGIPLPPCCEDGGGACEGLCLGTVMMAASAIAPMLARPPPRIAHAGLPATPPMPAGEPLRPPIA